MKRTPGGSRTCGDGALAMRNAVDHNNVLDTHNSDSYLATRTFGCRLLKGCLQLASAGESGEG